MNELIAKLMKFLALESQNENIEVPGEVEKTEGKAEDSKKSVVDEKATKESEVKAESVKAQTGVVHENDNAELIAILKELSTKLDSKSTETKAVKETKNDNSELIAALKAFVDKADGSNGKAETKTTKTPAQSKKSAEGFNPAEPSETMVSDLAGAIALARSGNSQE